MRFKSLIELVFQHNTAIVKVFFN